MNTKKERILVIDDDVNILRVFKQILEKAGYLVETAETGKEALKKIQKRKVQLKLNRRTTSRHGRDRLVKDDVY